MGMLGLFLTRLLFLKPCADQEEVSGLSVIITGSGTNKKPRWNRSESNLIITAFAQIYRNII